MHNVKPKKHLGQHFLREKGIAGRIVSLLGETEGKYVIEIGPGTGALTSFLIDKNVNLVAVERDDESVEFLQKKYAAQKIDVHRANFLKWTPPPEILPAYWIGNLPYNISSPIFFKFLENSSWLEKGVFMIQKEVAKRMVSPANTKAYGVLSVLMQTFFDIRYEFSVSPKAFYPPPKVESAVISIIPKNKTEKPELSRLKKVVKAAFNQRRKKLKNALSGLSFVENGFPKEWLDLRAEQLSLDQFHTITEALL